MFTLSLYRQYKQTRIWSSNSKTSEWNNVFTNWSAGWVSVVAENDIFQFSYSQKYVYKNNGTSILFQLSYREKFCSFLTITPTFLPYLTAPASLGFAVSCLVTGDRARAVRRDPCCLTFWGAEVLLSLVGGREENTMHHNTSGLWKVDLNVL